MSHRVWLITGANSGLGLALSLHALAQGDQVIAGVRNLSKIPESLATAKPLLIDVSATDAEIKKAGQEALQFYGRVDVLVNNAGYSDNGPIEEVNDAGFKNLFQANFFGAVSLIQSLLPAFRAQRSGHILNISSIAGISPFAGFGAYNASKAALESVSDVLSQELKPFGIRVIIVEPGYFSTNFFTAAGQPNPNTPYTEPSQGFGVLEAIPKSHLAQGQVGDVSKAAARMFEAVSETGMIKDLVDRQGNKRDWLRLPLGPDCGGPALKKLLEIKENIEVFEDVWRSTDMDESQLKAAKEAAGVL